MLDKSLTTNQEGAHGERDDHEPSMSTKIASLVSSRSLTGKNSLTVRNFQRHLPLHVHRLHESAGSSGICLFDDSSVDGYASC
ncbi:hypothetical protein Mapa_005877 [Marchantia paleacea]|nr:hypothetical protein Mapa_005877 [Marchantia paleacea]